MVEEAVLKENMHRAGAGGSCCYCSEAENSERRTFIQCSVR